MKIIVYLLMFTILVGNVYPVPPSVTYIVKSIGSIAAPSRTISNNSSSFPSHSCNKGIDWLFAQQRCHGVDALVDLNDSLQKALPYFTANEILKFIGCHDVRDALWDYIHRMNSQKIKINSKKISCPEKTAMMCFLGKQLTEKIFKFDEGTEKLLLLSVTCDNLQVYHGSKATYDLLIRTIACNKYNFNR